MKLFRRLGFHTLFLTAIITLCHCLADTQVLAAATVERAREQFELSQDFYPSPTSNLPTIAADGLNILPNLIRNNITIANELGFSSVGEANPHPQPPDPNHAEVFPPPGLFLRGEDFPYLVFEIELRNLKNLGILPPGSGEGFLRSTTRLLVPITVGTEVKSSLTVRLITVNSGGREVKHFEVRRVGSKTLIQALTRERISLIKRLNHQVGTFLVQIPALNRDFLGYLNVNPADELGLHLIVLFRDQHYQEGKDLPARHILTVLAEEATNIDDNPQ
jgi:hypothetical protein